MSLPPAAEPAFMENNINPSPSQSPPRGPLGYPVSTAINNATNNPLIASSHAVPHPSQDHPSIRSCVTCRRRKVRCNKRTPCSNCVKAGVECIFPPPGRAPRKTKRPQDAELLSRLRRLEGVIEHLSEKKQGAPNTLPNSVSPPVQQESDNVTSREVTEAPQVRSEDAAAAAAAGCPFMLDTDPKAAKPRSLDHEFGRLVIDEGRSRYVSNRFWTSLGDEIEELQDILDPPSSDEEDYPSPESSTTQSTKSPNHDGFLFGYYSLSHSLRRFHPHPSKVPKLWDTYLENIAPLIPIVHKAVAKDLLMDAAQNPDTLEKNSEALIFVIYLVTIISMSPEQCSAQLGEDRDTAVSRYRVAVEQALARANLLNTQSLVLLQAAVLFLIAIRREDDTKFVLSMTSLVLRLGQGIGLHRDGTNFGLKPFETEMRRRLWWHICLLDARSAEDHGMDAQIHDRMYDTRLPLNINDDDITPDMQEMPEERAGFTEMTFCLVRCEITVTIRRVYANCPAGQLIPGNLQKSPENCGKLIQEVNTRLEERYIKYCDMNNPIQWVSATVARLILTKLWLIVHHPMTRPGRGYGNLSMASRESLFVTSVELAEFARLLTQDKNTIKWSWLFVTNMQWHSIAFILSELCVRPRSALTDRAWVAVNALYEDWAKRAKHRKGMLWRPLSRLIDRAAAFRAKQEEGMQAQPEFNPTSSIPPSFHASVWENIVKPDTSPRVPQELQTSPNFNQPSAGLDLDITKGPIQLINELFPDVNWLAVPSPQASTSQQVPITETANTMVPMDHLAIPQDTANSNQNWEEWDQVMRDFQMDMQEAQMTHPLGNISDWFA